MILLNYIRRCESWPWAGALCGWLRRPWRWLFRLRCRFAAYWHLRSRATLVLECPELERLPCVADAGRLRGGVQVMHNGILVERGCYYGGGSVPFFRRTRGIHEPQEEIAFATVLPHMPPGATMLELGSYWAFYSAWFARDVPAARCHLVESDPANLGVGPRNFRLNGLTPASASHRFIDDHGGKAEDGTLVTTVDQLAEELDLDRIHLLHADIQGFERKMLEGARRLITEARVDYCFLSTHGDELHAACRAFLAEHGFVVVLDVPQAGCFSMDGILVARRIGLAGPERIAVAMRGASSA